MEWYMIYVSWSIYFLFGHYKKWYYFIIIINQSIIVFTTNILQVTYDQVMLLDCLLKRFLKINIY